MSALSDALGQMDTEVKALGERVKAKVEDAEKKVADVPTAEDMAKIAEMTAEIKGMAV